MATSGRIVRFEEGMRLSEKESDLFVRQFLAMAAVTVGEVSAVEGQAPLGDFDMEFFVKVMIRLAGKRESLRRIASGEDLRWPED